MERSRSCVTCSHESRPTPLGCMPPRFEFAKLVCSASHRILTSVHLTGIPMAPTSDGVGKGSRSSRCRESGSRHDENVMEHDRAHPVVGRGVGSTPHQSLKRRGDISSTSTIYTKGFRGRGYRAIVCSTMSNGHACMASSLNTDNMVQPQMV